MGDGMKDAETLFRIARDYFAHDAMNPVPENLRANAPWTPPSRRGNSARIVMTGLASLVAFGLLSTLILLNTSFHHTPAGHSVVPPAASQTSPSVQPHPLPTPTVLTRQLVLGSYDGFRVDPAPAGTTPRVSGTQALIYCRAYYQRPCDSVRLGLLTYASPGEFAYSRNRLVWVVEYANVFCDLFGGPAVASPRPLPSPRSDCTSWYFIDATTNVIVLGETQG